MQPAPAETDPIRFIAALGVHEGIIFADSDDTRRIIHAAHQHGFETGKRFVREDVDGTVKLWRAQ